MSMRFSRVLPQTNKIWRHGNQHDSRMRWIQNLGLNCQLLYNYIKNECGGVIENISYMTDVNNVQQVLGLFWNIVREGLGLSYTLESLMHN